MILVSTLQFGATQRCQAAERFNVRRIGGVTNPVPGCKLTQRKNQDYCSPEELAGILCSAKCTKTADYLYRP